MRSRQAFVASRNQTDGRVGRRRGARKSRQESSLDSPPHTSWATSSLLFTGTIKDLKILWKTLPWLWTVCFKGSNVLIYRIRFPMLEGSRSYRIPIRRKAFCSRCQVAQALATRLGLVSMPLSRQCRHCPESWCWPFSTLLWKNLPTLPVHGLCHSGSAILYFDHLEFQGRGILSQGLIIDFVCYHCYWL